MMLVTDSLPYVIRAPSIPLTLKDINATIVERIPAPQAAVSTMDPGHQAILEMHENSETTALFYVGIVLILYILGMIAVLSKYRRSERYESRLTRLYDEFMNRDRYLLPIPKKMLPVSRVNNNDKETKPDVVISIPEEVNV